MEELLHGDVKNADAINKEISLSGFGLGHFYFANDLQYVEE